MQVWLKKKNLDNALLVEVDRDNLVNKTGLLHYSGVTKQGKKYEGWINFAEIENISIPSKVDTKSWDNAETIDEMPE